MEAVIDRRPARRLVGVSVAAAFVSAGTAAAYGALAVVPGTVAMIAVLVGLTRDSRRAFEAGVALLLATALLAGLEGVAPVPLLVGVGAALVAWDTGAKAFSIGRQLGRGTDTTGLERFHAGVAIGVGVVSAGTGYAVYRLVGGAFPLAAVVLIALAAGLLVRAVE